MTAPEAWGIQGFERSGRFGVLPRTHATARVPNGACEEDAGLSPWRGMRGSEPPEQTHGAPVRRPEQTAPGVDISVRHYRY